MKWAEPPARQTEPGMAYEKDAALLRENPGRWGIVKTIEVVPGKDRGRSVATDIKKGKYVAFRPAGSFSARSVREWDDELGRIVLHIYARYTGEGK